MRLCCGQWTAPNPQGLKQQMLSPLSHFMSAGQQGALLISHSGPVWTEALPSCDTSTSAWGFGGSRCSELLPPRSSITAGLPFHRRVTQRGSGGAEVLPGLGSREQPAIEGWGHRCLPQPTTTAVFQNFVLTCCRFLSPGTYFYIFLLFLLSL